MPLSFPSSPSVGDQSAQNGRTYSWDGYAWTLVASVETHASTHATGGSDAITPASISAAPAASPTFTGVVTVAAGSVSAPAITTAGDTNTGIYFAGADAVVITTGGVLRQHWGSAGNVGIGASATAARSLLIGKTITGATSAYGVIQQGAVQSDVTVGATGIYNILNAQAASFTCGAYTHFLCASNALTGGASVTTQIGYSVSSTLNGATNNYGYSGSIAAATGCWNLYMGGTAQNYLAGNLGIGSGASTPGSPLDVAGDNIRVRTSKTPASATDTGLPGQWCWDGSYLYCCTAVNTWRRTALSSW